MRAFARARVRLHRGTCNGKERKNESKGTWGKEGKNKKGENAARVSTITRESDLLWGGYD